MFSHLAAAAGTDSSTTAAALTAPLMAAAGIVLLGALLPFAASFILDGLVILATRRRPAGIAIGAALTALIAAAGTVMWSIGASSPAMAVAQPGYQQALTTLLPITCTLAFVGFVIRQVKNLARPPRRA